MSKAEAKAALITIVFLVVALQFLFPHNRFLPLDRRIAGLLGNTFLRILALVLIITLMDLT